MPFNDPIGIHYFPGEHGPAQGVVRGSFKYDSTLDTTIKGMYAHYGYDNRLTGLPIVVLMHGYEQDASTMTPWIMQDMALYGFFAVAVAMRGRNPMNNTLWDISARELHDIVDAVEYVKTNFAAFVDPANVNVAGYSGGGGNVFGLAAKFPDYFRVYASHFGISDYGYDAVNSWYVTNPTRQASLEQYIGFNRTGSGLDAYLARAHQFGAAQNLQGGYLYAFHDSQDTNVPSIQSQMVKTQFDALSRTNMTLNISTGTSNPRWLHASPDADQQVRFSRDIWGPPIKAKTYQAWTIPAAGTIRVCGYIKTKLFKIFLGGGKTEAATVVYDTVAGTYTVTPLTGTMDVVINQGAKSKTQTITAVTTLTVV